jgi:hypothetical protein
MRRYRNVTKAPSNLLGRRAILACHVPEVVHVHGSHSALCSVGL